MTPSINSVTNRSLGNLTSFKSDQAGISGETSFGKFKVTVYSDSICRISITLNEAFENFSYAVVASPEKSGFAIQEHDEEILIRTDSFHLHVSRNPVRFKFTNPGGQVMNEDDSNLGTSWIGEQVSTYKKLQEGERFIGLGEKTGPLDQKGSGYQNWNTDAYAYHSGTDPLYCSTPFFIGIHHRMVYGIYLDNTHKTFFNFGASNNRFS